MTSLMIFLPVAICGLIAVVAGFYYARLEHKRMRALRREQRAGENAEPYLPFVEMTHPR